MRTWATTHVPGATIPGFQSEWHQLVYASRGVMTVYADEGTWVVPPHRAVWVPAGVRHRIEMSGRVSIRSLFLRPSLSSSLPGTCRAVNVSPLLRELILHVVKMGMLNRRVSSHARLVGVLLDQLRDLSAVPIPLPAPRDPRARRASDSMQGDPGSRTTLARIAKTAGTSRRTLERLFRDDTGMTLGQWRRRLRLVTALRLLAEGKRVTAAALEAGYESPSAFVAMFKRELGITPGKYFASGEPP